MNPPSVVPGAVAPCRSGHLPARVFGELLAAAALERERVRDPDALPAERTAPEPAELIAGIYRPITAKSAAANLQRLATALHDADPRTRRKG